MSAEQCGVTSSLSLRCFTSIKTYDTLKGFHFIATLPGMWERTITIGSAGKTYSATGWKLGWSIGPAHLIKHLQTVHQNSIYTCPTPLQEALAHALFKDFKRMDEPECYFSSLPRELQAKRDRMALLLQGAGLKPIVPEGGYFMVADISKLGNGGFYC
ncbi:hypothetical protein FKM82_017690 [Ascaphus truei]